MGEANLLKGCTMPIYVIAAMCIPNVNTFILNWAYRVPENSLNCVHQASCRAAHGMSKGTGVQQ